MASHRAVGVSTSITRPGRVISEREGFGERREIKSLIVAFGAAADRANSISFPVYNPCMNLSCNVRGTSYTRQQASSSVVCQ